MRAKFDRSLAGQNPRVKSRQLELLVEKKRRGGGGGADLLADADDDVGIAGSEVADGEVHSPHHAHLQQPDEMVQHGSGTPLLSSSPTEVLSSPQPQRRRSSRLFLDGFLCFFYALSVSTVIYKALGLNKLPLRWPSQKTAGDAAVYVLPRISAPYSCPALLGSCCCTTRLPHLHQTGGSPGRNSCG